MMADPGFLPGIINVGIDMAIGQIIHHVGIAVTCKRELESLRDLVTTIEPMITQIHRCHLELNRKREKGTSTAGSDINVLEINTCITNLHALLQRALTVVQECSVPRCNVFSRYQSSRRITTLISEIEKHLKLQVPLVQLQMQQQMQMQRDSAQPSSSTSATTSEGLAPTTGGFLIQEPLIVGQEKAFTLLEMWLIDIANVNSIFRIGIVGKGGSGKTLLLKRLFSNQKVRDFFSDGFLLWLTVSQTPSLRSLRYELCRQVAMQTNAEFSQNMMEEDAKNWLNQRMQGKRFSLFLDDVWGEGGKLLEDLGVALLTDHSSNSKIIVSSRDRRALLEMGVPENSTITVGDLVEKDSWDLFAYHAFAYNGRNLPANIGETTAKLVCAKCGGLPLAIKVVGRSMAGITDPEEWKLAVRRLPNEKKQDRQALYDALRWSYDSLGNYHVNLQMCFLYLAAALREDQVVHAQGMVIPLWVGEGLVAHNRLRDQPGLHEDPFQIGRNYVNVLADRCLIEPILRDIDGRVVTFRVHDVIHALAIQIAEVDEKFYCRAGMALTVLAPNDCSGCTRLMLNDNELTSLPQLWRAPQLSSLLMRNNLLTEIPRKVIGSMISLKVLDLSGTSLKSLPESVGCLKQLECLKLVGVPIKRLPASLTTLANLEILDLGSSAITELPSDIDRLRCLRYLRMYECDDLQCLPRSISGLTSLELLNMSYCSKVWAKRDKKRRWKKVASIGHLSTLTQLKLLRVQNNGETISDGTLRSMLQMETLQLQLTAMTYVPDDIFNMSKLRRFSLECSHVLKMESKFCEFQHLGHLRLWNCRELEELPDLHKLSSLKHLDIFKCVSLKKIPKEFSERGAFSSLEIFSLAELDKLEELPLIKEGAMPMLKILIMMNCEALQMLPESYLNLKTLHKVRVYGCPMVSENLHRVTTVDTQVKVVTMSTRDTKEVIKKYMQVRNSKIGWSYGEFWYNELWLFLRELYTPL